MNEVIQEYKEIDRNSKNLISPIIHVLSMLGSVSLTIRHGPERSEGPNVMMLVKSLPTYTYWPNQYTCLIFMYITFGDDKRTQYTANAALKPFQMNILTINRLFNYYR